MKTHTPPSPFHSLKVEKRLALGLLAQPQSRNRKRNHDDDRADAWLTITAFATIATVLVPIILFLIKR
jgi:hypothetical protein